MIGIRYHRDLTSPLQLKTQGLFICDIFSVSLWQYRPWVPVSSPPLKSWWLWVSSELLTTGSASPWQLPSVPGLVQDFQVDLLASGGCAWWAVYREKSRARGQPEGCVCSTQGSEESHQGGGSSAANQPQSHLPACLVTQRLAPVLWRRTLAEPNDYSQFWCSGQCPACMSKKVSSLGVLWC